MNTERGEYQARCGWVVWFSSGDEPSLLDQNKVWERHSLAALLQKAVAELDRLRVANRMLRWCLLVAFIEIFWLAWK